MKTLSIIFYIVVGIATIIRFLQLFNIRARYHELTIMRRMRKEKQRDIKLNEMSPKFVLMCIGESLLFLISVCGLLSTEMVGFMVIIATGFVPCTKKWWVYARHIIIVVSLFAILANHYFQCISFPFIAY